MLRLKKVAVTGSIASGKSSVSQIFEELGAYVVSADKVVHHLLANDPSLIQQLKTLLGSEVVKEGKVDRKAMGEKIFRDAELRKQAEELIHPRVRSAMERELMAAKAKGHIRLFVAEIPLFFESHLDDAFDLSIAVTAPRSLRLERFKRSTGYDDREFLRRESSQLSDEEKTKRAHFVLHNEGSLQELKEQVILLNQHLTH